MTDRIATLISLRGLGLLLVLVFVGCANPVGVRHLDAKSVHRALTSNVLTTGELSLRTRQVLDRSTETERFKKDPEATLAAFHVQLAEGSAPELLFPMAEMSFYFAERSGRKDHYLASAIYSYAWLFGHDEGTVADALDPHIRLAADLYNQSVAAVFEREKSGKIADRVLLTEGTYRLPFGEVNITIDPATFELGDYVYEDFISAAELDVIGLRNRFRRAGIGAPLAARLRRKTPLADDEVEYLSPLIRSAVTAVLHIADPVEAIAKTSIDAKIVLYRSSTTDRVEIDGRRISLEYELTSALAYGLANDSAWNFEISGFFSSEDHSSFVPINFLVPYQRGRVPVVLVHGTASSPSRWADLVNELYSHVWFRENFQFWLFRYDTGNPVAYSAGILNEELKRVVNFFDPDGKDGALARMVVIGHSQGGLLTKMTAIDSGDKFWSNISDVPFWEEELTEKTRELIQRSLFFKPLPFIERLIFICTPHRGSYRAGGRIGRFASSLVTLPLAVAGALAELAPQDDEGQAISDLGNIPTSVENMNPNNPFLNTLLSIPVAADVHTHSIIAVKGKRPLLEDNDGVVEYSSAHLDDVESEIVIQSGHSVQSNPKTVREVYRILREHLASPRQPGPFR